MIQPVRLSDRGALKHRTPRLCPRNVLGSRRGAIGKFHRRRRRRRWHQRRIRRPRSRLHRRLRLLRSLWLLRGLRLLRRLTVLLAVIVLTVVVLAVFTVLTGLILSAMLGRRRNRIPDRLGDRTDIESAATAAEPVLERAGNALQRRTQRTRCFPQRIAHRPITEPQLLQTWRHLRRRPQQPRIWSHQTRRCARVGRISARRGLLTTRRRITLTRGVRIVEVSQRHRHLLSVSISQPALLHQIRRSSSLIPQKLQELQLTGAAVEIGFRIVECSHYIFLHLLHRGDPVLTGRLHRQHHLRELGVSILQIRGARRQIGLHLLDRIGRTTRVLLISAKPIPGNRFGRRRRRSHRRSTRGARRRRHRCPRLAVEQPRVRVTQPVQRIIGHLRPVPI
ncbi:Uncharacterised protein [Mycobacteroides abscessus subsp. abscessus]|nr:Uncharacterised protein [Mycobacteroides abscessus subsp. abscessus]